MNVGSDVTPIILNTGDYIETRNGVQCLVVYLSYGTRYIVKYIDGNEIVSARFFIGNYKRHLSPREKVILKLQGLV